MDLQKGSILNDNLPNSTPHHRRTKFYNLDMLANGPCVSFLFLFSHSHFRNSNHHPKTNKKGYISNLIWGPSRACVKLVRPLFHVIYMNTRTWDYRLQNQKFFETEFNSNLTIFLLRSFLQIEELKLWSFILITYYKLNNVLFLMNQF